MGKETPELGVALAEIGLWTKTKGYQDRGKNLGKQNRREN
jgi:hypothetical protein